MLGLLVFLLSIPTREMTNVVEHRTIESVAIASNKDVNCLGDLNQLLHALRSGERVGVLPRLLLAESRHPVGKELAFSELRGRDTLLF